MKLIRVEFNYKVKPLESRVEYLRENKAKLT